MEIEILNQVCFEFGGSIRGMFVVLLQLVEKDVFHRNIL